MRPVIFENSPIVYMICSGVMGGRIRWNQLTDPQDRLSSNGRVKTLFAIVRKNGVGDALRGSAFSNQRLEMRIVRAIAGIGKIFLSVLLVGVR